MTGGPIELDAETIHDQVRQRFSSVATDAASEKRLEIGRANPPSSLIACRHEHVKLSARLSYPRAS
jgi:hypothetical protein